MLAITTLNILKAPLCYEFILCEQSNFYTTLATFEQLSLQYSVLCGTSEVSRPANFNIFCLITCSWNTNWFASVLLCVFHIVPINPMSQNTASGKRIQNTNLAKHVSISSSNDFPPYNNTVIHYWLLIKTNSVFSSDLTSCHRMR